jgi:hypothetical protein
VLTREAGAEGYKLNFKGEQEVEKMGATKSVPATEDDLRAFVSGITAILRMSIRGARDAVGF